MNSCLAASDAATVRCWEAFFAPPAVDPSGVDLETGDLILAGANPSGRTPGLNSIGTCRWDHVGVVVVREGVPYVVDSGSTRYYPFCTRPLHFSAARPADAWASQQSGPQMYRLSQFVAALAEGPLQHSSPPWTYERLAVRRLREPLTSEQRGSLLAALEALADVPYERRSGEMTAGAVDALDCCGVLRNREELRHSLFCSELVAAAFMEAKLLPPSSVRPANEYVPSDFARDRGGNLSSLCGCCCASWLLGRCLAALGCGELRSHATGELLLGAEVLLRTRGPPAATMARGPAPAAA